LNSLTISALLYDIGNFWIDRKLLTAPRVFDQQEKRIVEEHTIIGYQTLRETFDEEVARVAYQHHERYDGSGYPCKVSRDEIDLFSRIVSICDVYMSLVTPRPYRQKYEPLEAMEFILGAGGTLFDPEIVPVFLEIIPVYSVGSMVELSNRCIAIVVNTTDKPLGRPVVEILYDESGMPMQDTFLDLTEHLTISIKRIL
jgi:HD-GYP domain-containing protein (c-di-GMP phosphodiesterase class II)